MLSIVAGLFAQSVLQRLYNMSSISKLLHLSVVFLLAYLNTGSWTDTVPEIPKVYMTLERYSQNQINWKTFDILARLLRRQQHIQDYNRNKMYFFFTQNVIILLLWISVDLSNTGVPDYFSSEP